MTKALPIAAVAALALLAACDKGAKQEAANAQNAAEAANVAAAAVELPPAITAQNTYRCDDNSAVSVDFFAGEMQANLHPADSAPPVMLKAEAAGQPYVADGYSLTGKGDAITLEQPGKPSQSCKA